MSIAASDLIAFGTLNRPEDDTSTSGGDQDIDNRPSFTQLAANDNLEVGSSSASDTTQVVTVTGRNAAGEYTSSTATLTGTTFTTFTPDTTFERVLKVSMNADAVGTVTVRRSPAGATVGTIPIGERGFFALFIKSTSTASTTNRYEKIVWKNTHGTLTLTSAFVTLTADPSEDANHDIQMGLDTAVNSTSSVSNRLTAPGGVSFVDENVDQNVPGGGNLTSGSFIGTWIRLFLAASATPLRSTFDTQLTGSTV